MRGQGDLHLRIGQPAASPVVCMTPFGVPVEPEVYLGVQTGAGVSKSKVM